MIVEHLDDCGWHRDWHSCTCGLFDTLYWNVPDENGENIEMFCSAQEAAESMINTAAAKGYTYSNIKDAIEDFIAINWASYERSA